MASLFSVHVVRRLGAATVLGFALLLAGCPAPTQVGDVGTAPSVVDNPVQHNHAPRELGEVGGWRIVAVADYAATVRVLGIERYRFDRMADALPLDLAAAWGPAASDEVQSQLHISQGNRWYYWRTRGPDLPLPRKQLNDHMANIHLVPATPKVRRALDALNKADVVLLRGSLVNLEERNGPGSWKTSMSRTDSGAGSCETLYVTDVLVH